MDIVELRHHQAHLTHQLSGHKRNGVALRPCAGCGNGRLASSLGDHHDDVYLCPACDGVYGLEAHEVALWLWKYGVPVAELVARTP